MTDAAILLQAAERPAATAVINNGSAIPYAALAKAMTQFANALHALGLRPGQMAAIECRDQYLHLLLLLAAERLGVATVSFVARELATTAPTTFSTRPIWWSLNRPRGSRAPGVCTRSTPAGSRRP